MDLRRVDPTSLDLALGRLRQLPEAAVREKLASLRSKGQLSALAAAEHEGRLVLVDGFVRQLAAVRLGLAQVSVEVVHVSQVQMKAQMFLRNRERGLLLLEECRLVHELHIADGLQQVEIADLLERHKSWVCRRVSLWSTLSPNLVCDASVGLLDTGSLRRLAQLPPRNQEALVAVARRDALSPRDTSAFIDLWRKATEPDARQYLVDHPRAALALARGERETSSDPRLGDAGNRLSNDLDRLAHVALRIQRRVADGLGSVPPQGCQTLKKAHREAHDLCSSALGAVAHWLERQEGTV